MSVTGRSPPLCLFLLLCLLPLCPAEDLTTSDMTTTVIATETTNTTPLIPEEKLNKTTLAECLIDNQMGLIAIGSAGGLIVCLLVSVVTLACQVYHLQRRVYIPRSSRSNLDLVGNAGYWAKAAAGTGPEGGLVGPCDTSVMLEEVKAQDEDGEIQESGDVRGERFEEEQEEEEEEEGGAAGTSLSPEEKPLMQSSASRESCSELPHNLEDMPLVV